VNNNISRNHNFNREVIDPIADKSFIQVFCTSQPLMSANIWTIRL